MRIDEHTWKTCRIDPVVGEIDKFIQAIKRKVGTQALGHSGSADPYIDKVQSRRQKRDMLYHISGNGFTGVRKEGKIKIRTYGCLFGIPVNGLQVSSIETRQSRAAVIRGCFFRIE